MPLFDDMTIAVKDYPLTDVEIEIVDVSIPGSVLNADEVATFRVRVTNRGPLRLNGVTVRVQGQNGARVKNVGAADPFVAEFVSGARPRIDAHGGSELFPGTSAAQVYGLKAPASPQASRTLVKATLEAWDPDLDHVLLAHSDPASEPAATFAAQVAPV